MSETRKELTIAKWTPLIQRGLKSNRLKNSRPLTEFHRFGWCSVPPPRNSRMETALFSWLIVGAQKIFVDWTDEWLWSLENAGIAAEPRGDQKWGHTDLTPHLSPGEPALRVLASGLLSWLGPCSSTCSQVPAAICEDPCNLGPRQGLSRQLLTTDEVTHLNVLFHNV
jgi:hypothetical protein